MPRWKRPKFRNVVLLALALAGLLSKPAPARAGELRVVTFNVAMGQAFRKPFTGLIRSTFIHNDRLRRFDVIGLQEACANDRTAIELFRGVMKRAHGRVYEHLVVAEAKSGGHCQKSQVILSRYPFVRAGGLVLPKVGARRSAAWVDIQVGREVVRVYNLHLSNRKGGDFAPTEGRWTQGKVVLDHWLETKRASPSRRGIVLGDFNSMSNLWRPAHRETTLLAFAQSMTPNLRRFVPTMIVPYQNDWIFSSGMRLRRSYVVPTVYSDHFVVMADYTL